MTVGMPAPMCWSVVVPVKGLATAKSRLRAAVPADLHPALVLAMTADTVAAALAAFPVRLVVVVADDPAAVAAARRLGAMALADSPAAGLNAALRYGAEQASATEPRCGIAALTADLPALSSVELSRALAAAAAHPRAFVADHRGSGTTMLTARPGWALSPAYGENSRVRHAEGGAVDLLAAATLPAGSVRSVRSDVDTPTDLLAARALGLGRHTAALLHALAS